MCLPKNSIRFQAIKLDGEISAEKYSDPEFTADVEEAVRDALEEELTGDEDYGEARELARQVVDEELEELE